MKKTYFQPEMEVIAMEMQPLMTASLIDIVDDKITPGSDDARLDDIGFDTFEDNLNPFE